ncbi:V-type proton ATPase subunit D2-like protein, partial [Ostreococcus tauri]
FRELMYSLKDGFVDALVRGLKSELLSADDYDKIRQCESLADLKLYLASKRYRSELQSESDGLDPTRLVQLCVNKFVKHFKQLVVLASEPLTTVFKYITYSFMIDNVVLIMAGAVQSRSFAELSANCHPLGLFESIENLLIASDVQAIYRLVLIDTPISSYFSECLGHHALDETRIEFIRNSVHKAYLEDFVRVCQSFHDGSYHESVILDLIHFEADRRVINISISALDTEMSESDKLRLFPACGSLFPAGQAELARCTSWEEIQIVIRTYASSCPHFWRLRSVESGSLDKVLCEIESELCNRAFMSEAGHALFVAYVKLYEQELRNIMWIAECLVQQQQSRIDEGLVYLASKTTAIDLP